jgi:hypothetical protein
MTAASKQGRKHRPKPHRRLRRALELLASCADGCTEAILIAHGFTVEQMVELVRIGHATAQTERVIAGGREDLFDALTSSRARLTDRYQADHEILKRLKRKKCEAKRDAYHRARKLLEANKEQAIKVAEYLIEHGKIDGVAVERLFPV